MAGFPPLRSWRFAVLVVSFVSLSVFGEAAEGERHVLILSGSGGESFYSRTFEDWSERLKSFLVREAEIASTNLVQLSDQATTPSLQPTLENIESTITTMREQVRPEDELLVFMIGHGSYIAGESRFNVPGPDLTAERLKKLLAPVDVSRLVVVNSTASSAGHINALSADGRIIVTATKSVNERNATQFMESFLQGLEDGSADRNRDGRISLLEAARQAAHLNRDWFESQGYLVTEHPLIDDNGDGLGTRLIPEEEGGPAAAEYVAGEGVALDGALAGRYFLKDFSFPPEVPDALAQRYIDTLDRVEALKSEKAAYDADAYRAKLEPLLIEAARTHRQIRRLMNQTSPEVRSGPNDDGKANPTPNVSRQ